MNSKTIIMGILNRARSVAGMLGAIATVLRNSEFNLPINNIRVAENAECVIMGNGPSLDEVLSTHLDFFTGKTIICVNEFAFSEYFEKVRPEYYVFLDPAYWARTVAQNFKEDFRKLTDQLIKVTWPMKIFIPTLARDWNMFIDLSKVNENIEIFYFNRTAISPIDPCIYVLYKKNLAMPPAQNVLVGCIFLALNMRFKKIYLLGADHSWHENLFVDDNNNLFLKNNHFYDKTVMQLVPIYKTPDGSERFKVHELFAALSLKFKGYIILEDYSKYLGAKVYNATNKSYIDAFERFTIKN